MKRFLQVLLYFLGIVLLAASVGYAQPDIKRSNPKVAFLKSLAIPGWGHYYVDKSNWSRGQYHLAGEAALVLSYLGFSVHANSLQQNWYTYGRSEAGVPIKNRSRRFQLAVGNFDNLQAYNDYQLRNRQWDQLFDDTPQNRWNWENEAQRKRYDDLRSRFERIEQQLPALLALMAVNRVISGISAYNRAQKQSENAVQSTVYLSPYRRVAGGMVANVKIDF